MSLFSGLVASRNRQSVPGSVLNAQPPNDGIFLVLSPSSRNYYHCSSISASMEIPKSASSVTNVKCT